MGTLTVVLVLVVLPCLVLALVAQRISIKERRRLKFLGGMDRTFRDVGAVPVDMDVYRRGDRHYAIDAVISPVFSRGLSLRLSAFCDSLYEFVPQDIREDMAPELAQYLAKVREPLERAYPRRWASFSKRHLELILAGNRFPDESYTADDLRADLDTLDALAAVPLQRSFAVEVVTWRAGFERDLPAWHWKPEQIDRLPEGSARLVFSMWCGDPLLHPAILESLFALAGESPTRVLTDADDLSFLRYAYPDLDDPLRSRRAEVLAAADRHLDGDFFLGMIAGDVPLGEFEGLNRFFFHDTAIGKLGGALFYARRLLDDEASWWSGEVEIVSPSLTVPQMRGALEETAQRLGARLVELDGRFSKRLLKRGQI